jgi:hypothetical protein
MLEQPTAGRAAPLHPRTAPQPALRRGGDDPTDGWLTCTEPERRWYGCWCIASSNGAALGPPSHETRPPCRSTSYGPQASSTSGAIAIAAGEASGVSNIFTTSCAPAKMARRVPILEAHSNEPRGAPTPMPAPSTPPPPVGLAFPSRFGFLSPFSGQARAPPLPHVDGRAHSCPGRRGTKRSHFPKGLAAHGLCCVCRSRERTVLELWVGDRRSHISVPLSALVQSPRWN